MKTENTAFKTACSYFGSQKNLAHALGVTEQSVSGWKGVVPLDRCLDLEIATNGAVRCHELRPGKFPIPDKAA